MFTQGKLVALVILIAPFLFTGCATITTGQNQSLSVETRDKGMAVAGAACKLTNDKGAWFITTPGSVTVNRSYSDMAVNCTHEKHDRGIAVVKSGTKAMMFGNIIAGGIIGAAVDAGTGAGYDYPSLINVEMGMNQTLPVEARPADPGPPKQ